MIIIKAPVDIRVQQNYGNMYKPTSFKLKVMYNERRVGKDPPPERSHVSHPSTNTRSPKKHFS